MFIFIVIISTLLGNSIVNIQMCLLLFIGKIVCGTLKYWRHVEALYELDNNVLENEKTEFGKS